MWAPTLDGDALRRSDSNTQSYNAHPHHNERTQASEEAPPTENSEVVAQGGEDTHAEGSTATPMPREGTWGEDDTGNINGTEAMKEYEHLRGEYHQLHKNRTGDSQKGGASLRLRKTTSSRAGRNTNPRRGSHASSTRPVSWARENQRVKSEIESLPDVDVDLEDDQGDDSEFELGEFLKEGHFEKRNTEGSRKRIGVLYEHLTVQGVNSGSKFVKTIPDAVIGTFGPDLYRLISGFFPALQFRKPSTRNLVNDFTGCVRNGEMMLVLGRPGSGCTTFLKAITNKRDSFASVTGEVSYGGISAKDQQTRYRGEVNYNPEDDTHFSTLTVWKTLTFALLNKTKKADLEDVPVMVRALLRMFGISHTEHTLVGDDMTRGVSGGERKRVSIAETLASKSSVVAWDNSTRGLDASTALDYARSLRIMTDISNRTTFVTLYQAGEGIYEMMDKVMVIEQGRQIFSGPASRAKQYFIDLGFECPASQTTADFLTAVTDPMERRFRPGFENKAPRTAEEFENAFRTSSDYQALQADVADYKSRLERTDCAETKAFIGAVQESKSKNVRDKSSYTISFYRQVLACTRREAWLLLGDTTTLWTKLFIVISNGLCIGSLFYGQSDDTAGSFSRGGTIFISILFLGWLQMAELMKAVSGRNIVSRHYDYAFYRPSAVTLARVLLDFPIVAIQSVLFGIIMYFLAGLDVEAGKFWIFLLFVFTTTFMLTSMYRMFASLSREIDTAVRFSGIALNVLLIYTGYIIPKTQLLHQKIWFGWLYWVNPISYSFEAVLSNEISSRTLKCAPSQLVPQGPGVDPRYQGCAVTGAKLGSLSISGADYLDASFNYSVSHVWRNFGVVVAFTVFYIVLTVFFTETVNLSNDTGAGGLIFKKNRKTKRRAMETAKPNDEEKTSETGHLTSNGVSSTPSSEITVATDVPEEVNAGTAVQNLARSDSIFTWKDVEYTVPYLGGERKLLNKVSGYAKPGVMIALMGSSGAGKTTLLYTLSQRQTVGVVSGEMLVDGNAPSSDFQRNTGFCLQGDIHDRTQTVREALEFSAILRQEPSVPRHEKIAYVDKIIELLELEELEDALITSLGVEQRKRLTIGVELAAKPSLLLFLDEPTSGLDSQGAYSIVRFLKKLCQNGQAIICTIHQPSSVLIQEFDMVLALNPGGNTFYFGPMGKRAEHITKYFANRGAICPPGKNIAEFVLETAARPHRLPDGTKIDWNKEWRESEEAQAVIEEIDSLKQVRSHATKGLHNNDGSKLPELAFAASSWLQTIELTKRMFRQHWRDPSYVYGKLFTSVIIGIFNGFTFWKLGDSIQDMESRMFTVFFIITIPPTIVNAVVPKFYENMSIWQAREYPSRIYGWVAFCTANVVSEIPAAILGAFLYWALWYWSTGLPAASSVSGYAFLMTVLMFFFMNSWGQWIAAFAPSFTVISNVLPFFFVMFSLYNGVIRPYETLPGIWKYFVYYLNPSVYWIGGMLSATLREVQIKCRPEETARFDPPPGSTCQEYAGAFVSQASGYLLNASATSDCQYCPYTTGVDYMKTIHIKPEDKWRDFGIFLAFCISNWFLVYFFIYTVRIRNWSFGFATIFNGLGKIVNYAKRPFQRS